MSTSEYTEHDKKEDVKVEVADGYLATVRNAEQDPATVGVAEVFELRDGHLLAAPMIATRSTRRLE